VDLIGRDNSLSPFGLPPDSPGLAELDDNDVAKVEMSKHGKCFVSPVKGQKRKSISDMVRDEGELIRVTRVKIAEVQAKEKTEREKVKRQAFTGVELECLHFQREEGEKQRAHEILMMNRQIELEKFKAIAAGHIRPSISDTNIDPSFRG
jgi:hypothetical protein